MVGYCEGEELSSVPVLPNPPLPTASQEGGRLHSSLCPASCWVSGTGTASKAWGHFLLHSRTRSLSQVATKAINHQWW